jgi:hypothetical protein
VVNPPHEDARVEIDVDELDQVGLTKLALAAAIRRAKQRTRDRSLPPARPRLDTDPDVDAWFD